MGLWASRAGPASGTVTLAGWRQLGGFIYRLAFIEGLPDDGHFGFAYRTVPSGQSAPTQDAAIEGTPLAKAEPVDPISFIRTVALARILMPMSEIRLSAGRTAMADEMQALCFFAGANSIFVGDTLLTASNPDQDKDHQLLRRLGMERLGATPPPSAPMVTSV